MSYQKLEQENLQSKKHLKMERWLKLERQSWPEGLKQGTWRANTKSFQRQYSTKTQGKENFVEMQKNLQIKNTINILEPNSFLM